MSSMLEIKDLKEKVEDHQFWGYPFDSCFVGLQRVFCELQLQFIKVLNSWFSVNIRKKECVDFIRSAKPSDAGKEVCGCGYTQDQHSEDHEELPSDGDLEWNPGKHTREVPTDAYGDLTFTGLGKSVVKYVRASSSTPPKILYEMMTKMWNLSVPNLLISVTGGTKNFSMKGRLKNLFSRGLIKAAQTTGAWILTGGTHTGVTKHVGEAVRDFSMSSSQVDSEIIAIGITSWGLLHNRNTLISTMGGSPAQYLLDEENQGKLCCLNNNHSHFILVDDGTHGRPGADTALRTELETFISEQTMEKGGIDLKIPVVCVVLEGGPETLDVIHQTMTQNTPCVIVEGLGGIADVIGQVATLNSSKITISLVQDKLRNLFPEAFDYFSEIQIIEWTKKIQDIVRMSQLLTVFREDKDGAQDMDVAILQALLKASRRLDHHGHENWDYQLKLAVSWNRVDIAKSDIFTDDKQWKPSDLYPVMTIALIDNKPDFVRLFLDHGVSLKEFLTWDTLTFLYNNMEPSSPIYSKLEKLIAEEEPLTVPKKGLEIQLYHVARVLRELLGEFTEVLYPNLKSNRSSVAPHINIKCDSVNTEQSKYREVKEAHLILGKKRKTHPKEPPALPVYPLRDILIWCILQNRAELAEIAWSQDTDCIAGALACSKILKELSKESDETDNYENMMALAALYEERAEDPMARLNGIEKLKTENLKLDLYIPMSTVGFVTSWVMGNMFLEMLCSMPFLGVFSECFRKNEARAEELLTRVSPAWGKTTCLQLALEAEAMSFMSQSGVQMLLTKIWWGKLSVDNGLISVLMCMLIFPLIYTGLVTFRKHASSSGRSKKPRPLSCVARLVGFFTAPVVVFYWNVVSYIGFLWLFSHVLMIDFQTLPSWREYLLYGWIFSVLCEELRQCFYDPEGMGYKKRSLLYISKFWNQVDALGLVLFVAGVACRFFSLTFYAGRILLSLDFIIFCVRLMHIFTISKVLGPKIIMMQRMMKDIFFFLFLLAVWIVSYGVAKQAILVHNEDRLDWILRNVIYQPYLILFGQIPMDVERSSFDVTKCTLNGTDMNLPKCAYADDSGNPLFPEWLTIILLCFYLLFANILIMNLLIAMFSYTFAEVQDHTDQIWKFQRHDLIEEYNNRPPAPPPFILLSLLYFLVKYVILRRPARGQKQLMRTMDESEAAALLSWESYMKENYLQSQQYEQNQSTDQKIRDTSDNMLLHLNCKIAKVDGSNTASDTKVVTIAYPIATIFNQVDITLDDGRITQSDNMYAYMAYIKGILNYSHDTLDTKISEDLFYKDTYGHFEDKEPDEDNQDKLLVNSIDLKIKLNCNKDSFCLISGDAAQYKLVILSTSLFVKVVKVSPTVRQAHAKALQLSKAKYTIERVALKILSIPTGSESGFRVSTVVNLFEVDQEKRSRMMEQRMAALEEQMSQSTKALSWIIETLTDSGFGSKESAPVLGFLALEPFTVTGASPTQAARWKAWLEHLKTYFEAPKNKEE
ncbi:transient receptor potential cation channel subfamily M member 2-like [Pleurodeles waltl]|uniref:transient receptor potential cation channel subfamily M member 2-like n=1 Tax=Pleurodeles waltl TaxID=8319 RepID=UPI0037099E38